MPLPESEKIPTTLVVGFLGAGKSSLINHILASRPTKPDGSTTRCAVVENELGEVGIDSHLGAFSTIESRRERNIFISRWLCERASEREKVDEREARGSAWMREARRSAWMREREKGEEALSLSLQNFENQENGARWGANSISAANRFFRI